MIEKKSVSIIIPVYNVEEWIEECLESLRQQTYSEYEIILVDDGSTDKSGIICDQFAATHASTCVLHQNNQGVSVARNNGIRHATGEYIVFIDPDDVISKDYLEVLISTMENENSEMAIARYCCEDVKLLENSNRDTRIENIKARHVLDYILDGKSYDGYLWNKIFLRSIINENNISFDENVNMWEDLCFVIKYLKCINQCTYINRIVYFYRQRPNSAIRKKSIDKLNSKVQVCLGFINMGFSKESLFFRNAVYLYVIYITEYGFCLLKNRALSSEQSRDICYNLKKYKWAMPKSIKYFVKYALIKMRCII